MLSLLSFLLLVVCICLFSSRSVRSWGGEALAREVSPSGEDSDCCLWAGFLNGGAVFSSEGPGVLLPAQRVQVTLRAHSSHTHMPVRPVLDLKAHSFPVSVLTSKTRWNCIHTLCSLASFLMKSCTQFSAVCHVAAENEDLFRCCQGGLHSMLGVANCLSLFSFFEISRTI